MRVIAGSAGGIPLVCPRWEGVRPTMDQVRAAVFSSLADRVPGARVLDLFAGTGGLGIEALSRGARSATFVERDRRAAECIRKNLQQTRLASAADVIGVDVFAYLRRVATGTESPRYDLVFADPPYTSTEQPRDFAGELLADAALPGALADGGMFVLEKSPRRALPVAAMQGWEVTRQKRYGTTEVVFLRRGAAGI